MAKENSRVVLDSIMTPRGVYVDSLVLEQFENLDNDIVANTAEKRQQFAIMLAHSCNSFNQARKALMNYMRAEGKKVGSEDFGLRAAVDAVEHADKAAVMGYIVGRFAQNNEYLDKIVAQLRMKMQSGEAKIPEVVEMYKKERENKLNKALNEIEKDIPNLDREKTRQWIDRKPK